MDRYGLLHIAKTGGTAANAVIKQNNRCGKGEYVECYRHQVGLRDIHENNMCERLMFFVREPVARFISAFNSRLRKGYPRHPSEWSPREKIAFTHFKTANELAEALGAEDDVMRNEAIDAIRAIRHLRRSYRKYLDSVDLLELEKERIYFIGATETFNSDFDVMRRFLGVDPHIELPTDDFGAHRAPDDLEKTVSEIGRRNVQEHYQVDYPIYQWCTQRREELLTARLAELG